MLIEFKLMTRIVMQQLWTKEFIRFLKFPCSRQKNQLCFDGYLSVVFELWIFIHYKMLIEFKLMTSIVIQQLWTKEFIRFLKFPCSRQKTNCASTDIYPLFLNCGYSSTIGCSSSLLTNADC